MEVTSLESLVALAPKKQENFGEKVKGWFKKKPELSEPSADAVAKAATVESRLMGTEMYKGLQAVAELDAQQGKEVDEVRKREESSRTRIAQLREQQKAMEKMADRIVKGKDVDYAADENPAIALHDEMTGFMDIKKERKQKEATLADVRGEMLLVPVSDDLKMFDSIRQSEARSTALELDLIKGMESVSRIDSGDMSNAALDELRRVSADSLSVAVSVAKELDDQKWGLDRVIERRILRYPDPAAEDTIRSQSEKYLEGKKQAMKVEAGETAIEVDAKTAAESLMTTLKTKFFLTDETLIGQTMLKMGLERDTTGEWKMSEESPYRLREIAAEGFRTSMEEAKKTLIEAQTNPDRSVAAYFKMNEAITFGDAGRDCENKILIMMNGAATEQMKMNLKAKKAEGEKARLAEEAIRKAQEKTAVEKAAGGFKKLFGWVKEAATKVANTSARFESNASDIVTEEIVKRTGIELDARDEVREAKLKIEELNKRIAALEARSGKNNP